MLLWGLVEPLPLQANRVAQSHARLAGGFGGRLTEAQLPVVELLVCER